MQTLLDELTGRVLQLGRQVGRDVHPGTGPTLGHDPPARTDRVCPVHWCWRRTWSCCWSCPAAARRHEDHHGARTASRGEAGTAAHAPALALVDLGIAMGVPGTDVAVETADVALVGDDRRRLSQLRDLGDRTPSLIRQGYGASIAVNGVGLAPGAAGALSPVLVAIAHNASSVFVVVDSARLIRYRLPPRRGGAQPSNAPPAGGVRPASGFAQRQRSSGA
nr:cation-translocating P-type ATPase [Kineococcus rhizosphaerae]